MFFLRRPPNQTLDRLLDSAAGQPFCYSDVGVTRGDHPPRRRRNHHRAELGSGEETFVAAVAALRSWAMYRLRWTEVYPAGAPTAAGSVFAVVARHCGFWSVNPCRVIYEEKAADADADVDAFAIGTLPGHTEQGEERFEVRWDRTDDRVRFELIAYAGPRHWLARLFPPATWLLQHHFGRQAIRAMQTAVDDMRAPSGKS